jgi:hypothetical protein
MTHNFRLEEDLCPARYAREAWLLSLGVMPEYPNLLKGRHADHFNVLRDHYPNVFRRS